MMLFDGEIYSDKVYPQPDTIDRWREVPMEQYNEWLNEQASEIAESTVDERNDDPIGE